MRYELWQGGDGGYSFFDVDNESARRLLDPADQLVWTVEANSWEEASQAQYDYLGWGTYKPVVDSDRSKLNLAVWWIAVWQKISKILRLGVKTAETRN